MLEVALCELVPRCFPVLLRLWLERLLLVGVTLFFALANAADAPPKHNERVRTQENSFLMH